MRVPDAEERREGSRRARALAAQNLAATPFPFDGRRSFLARSLASLSRARSGSAKTTPFPVLTSSRCGPRQAHEASADCCRCCSPRAAAPAPTTRRPSRPRPRASTPRPCGQRWPTPRPRPAQQRRPKYCASARAPRGRPWRGGTRTCLSEVSFLFNLRSERASNTRPPFFTFSFRSESSAPPPHLSFFFSTPTSFLFPSLSSASHVPHCTPSSPRTRSCSVLIVPRTKGRTRSDLRGIRGRVKKRRLFFSIEGPSPLFLQPLNRKRIPLSGVFLPAVSSFSALFSLGSVEKTQLVARGLKNAEPVS